MSKMKHLLRKLHIGGGGFNDDHHHPQHHQHHNNRIDPSPTPPTPTPTPPQTAAAIPSPASSSSTSSSGPALERSRTVDSAENSVDFNFFEEEFQVQLALAISVSDPDSREDPETAQIKAAKQISLGYAPTETLVDSLSLRYWSYNFVNYDEKVMDGFYDVYGVASNSGMQGKIPHMQDLQIMSVSDNVDYEVIIVNRATDPALHQLEEIVYAISVEHRVLEQGPIISGVIQKIAELVVDRMGGPVSDADEMLKRWTLRSYELRKSHNSIILPLGCLNVGLSRHRALLFKVLADRITLPCMLIKGSYYTGTDEGAVNLIKFDNGSEYIIDLMGAPGTLIPAEVPSDHLHKSGLDIKSSADYAEIVKDLRPILGEGIGTGAASPDFDSLTSEASLICVHSKGNEENFDEKNRTQRFENEFGKLLPSLCGSHERLSSTAGKASNAEKLKVKDVSKYVISAAKNPEFAQKLHAVLLEGVTSPPPHLFLDMNPDDLRDIEMLEKIHLLNGEKVDDWVQNFPDMFLSSNGQTLIPSTGVQSFTDAHYDSKQHLVENLVSELGLAPTVVNSGNSLPSVTTDEGFVLVNRGTNEMNETDVVGLGLVPVDPSGIVVRISHGEQSNESSIPSVIDYCEGQSKVLITDDGGQYVKDKMGKVESALRLTETASSGICVASRVQSERINQVLGDTSEWEISWEDLQIGERIGIGSFGEVYRSDWNGTEVAVKKFMDQDISGDALAQFKCEVEIMLRLRHPNVVLFMGAVTRPPNLSILTEYLPRGSLYKLLHRPNNQLDEKKRMRMALDVAKGMNYLHTSHPIIVHRDLKTPNLLVDKNWVVKVCDFGLSRMKHHTFLSSKSTAGTPEWMAPEVLRNEPSNEKSDVYSFGVILWELATLRVPWSGMNSMQVVGAVGFQNRHLDITEEIDPTAAEIIIDCWNLDPQSRPSFGQLITRLRRLRHLQHQAVQATQTQLN